MRSLRIAVVTLIGLYIVAAFVTTLVTFGWPVAEFGYNVGFDGVTLVNVEPGLPAAKAGLEVGDRFVYENLSTLARFNAILNEPVEPGSRLRLQVVHEGSVRDVVLTPVEFPSLYGASNLSYAFAGLALGAVSLALVLLRPSRMTWGFALIAPPLLLPEHVLLWSQRASPNLGLAYETVVALLYALQAVGLMIFASRFPNDDPRGLNRIVDRLAAPVGVAVVAVYVYVNFCIWLSSSPPHPWVLFTQDYVTTAVPSLAALIALVATYVTSANLRSRLAPTLVAFVLLIVTWMLQQFASVLTSNPGVLLFLYFAFSLSAIVLAVAVAYGVIRHRVIDVNFIVGRTLVISALTVFAVSIFAMIEYLFGKLLEHQGLATILVILAAVGLGLSLNALHNRLDKFVDVVLFRRRHLAEARLEQAARMLPHTTSRQLVDEMLVAEPAEAFDLASAAVFVLDEGENAYTRSVAQGWETKNVAALDANDHLVVRMRAELRAAHLGDLRWPRTDLPGGAAQPLYAIPIAVGSRVEAIALYGGHNSGEDLDADERRSLRALASGAALAYDHLVAQALRATLEEVRVENASLRHAERTLTELIKGQLKNTGAAG
jgi:hypothetical protein